MGVFGILIPHMPNLWIFFIITGFQSFNSGALDAGGNVLCLDVWQGRDGGPYMHSIHFSFAIGAFLSPLIAIPFLSNPGEQTKITYLYPLIGTISCIIAFGYLAFGINERNIAKQNEEGKPDETKKGQPEQALTKPQLLFIVLMWIFFFVYVGVEVTYGTYVTTFAVKSSLKLDKPTGAKITAVFWGMFATVRFVAIFAAMKMKTIYIMVASCSLSVAGAFILAVAGNVSTLAMYLASALLGSGMASIYASGVLWCEQFMVITNKIGAAFTVASASGADVYPILIGQYIETTPMILMYFTVSLIGLCTLTFFASIATGRHIKKSQEEPKLDNIAMSPN